MNQCNKIKIVLPLQRWHNGQKPTTRTAIRKIQQLVN